jgi:dGTPase
MKIRVNLEEREYEYLSRYACHSRESIGRDVFEVECELRTCYQRDRDRILHSKSFRRLKHKTQVFLAPQGDHYRTRLTHTLEVSQIARTIAKSLMLNEDLTEAIALGHDLGHTPFGHAGERALNESISGGFRHYEQSVRVVEKLENEGRGLNLTKEVRDGILNHRTSGKPSTLEGKIVRYADKIAYINHDIDDSIRAGILKEKDIPDKFIKILGKDQRTRLNTLISDIVINSYDVNDIIMSEDIENSMKELREFMFESVYRSPAAISQENKVCDMLSELYQHYLLNIEKIPSEYLLYMEKLNEIPEKVVCDYIAGMSDQYSVMKFEEEFIPNFWKEKV